MKLTLVRAIPLTLVVAVAGLVLSGVSRFKNAHHGVDAAVGEAAWVGFLVFALATLVLAGVALYRRRARGGSAAVRA